MSDVWAVIVAVILLMVVYAYITSKLDDRKKERIRKETIPLATDTLKTATPYNVHLSDGKVFSNVELLGSVEGNDSEFSFSDWQGMLVLKQENQKKVFLKKTSIRFIEEV